MGGAGVAAERGRRLRDRLLGREKLDELTGASDKLSYGGRRRGSRSALGGGQRLGRRGRGLGQGDHLEAIGDGASAVGEFAVGSAEAAADGIASVAGDTGTR